MSAPKPAPGHYDRVVVLATAPEAGGQEWPGLVTGTHAGGYTVRLDYKNRVIRVSAGHVRPADTDPGALMDFRSLLVKYIAHVGDTEGTDFLGARRRTSSFTDEEWAALKTLATESITPSTKHTDTDEQT